MILSLVSIDYASLSRKSCYQNNNRCHMIIIRRNAIERSLSMENGMEIKDKKMGQKLCGPFS